MLFFAASGGALRFKKRNHYAVNMAGAEPDGLRGWL